MHPFAPRQTSGRPIRPQRQAFTLIELLVVIAISAILVAMLLPALSRSKERAKVIKVHVELEGVGLALEMYSDDNASKLPPVRVNCNTDLATHWCQFPVELVEQHYLGAWDKPGMAANMEDVFNPNHTYKYAAPGPSCSTALPPRTTSFGFPTTCRFAPAPTANTTPPLKIPQCGGSFGAWGRSPTARNPRTSVRRWRSKAGTVARVKAV